MAARGGLHGPTVVLLLLATLLQLAIGASNCGDYVCPAGFRTKPAPASITCDKCNGGGPCTPGSTTDTCDANNNDNSLRCCNGNACTGGANPASPQANYGSCLSLTSGQTCTPSCNNGYTVGGPANFLLACLDTAFTFDGSAFTCNGVACAVPNSNMVAGDCSCNPGYSGMPQTSMGAWTHTCTANACSNGPRSGTADANAIFTTCNSQTTGVMCAYTCNPGFTAGAGFALVCDSSNQYDASAATCTGNMCMMPTAPDANAVYTACNTLRSGQTCTPTCNNGYVLTGSFSLVCDGAGNYPVPNPTCNVVACPANAGPPGTCTCNTGYKGTAAWSTSTGQWTHSCTALSCGDGPNAMVTASADYTDCNSKITGQSCTVSCGKGYSGTAAMITSVQCTETAGPPVTYNYADTSGIMCAAATCPQRSANAATMGNLAAATCGGCQANYLLDKSAETWDFSTQKWTHQCLASCAAGPYACPAGYSAVATPASVRCDTSDPNSCTTARCCTANPCVSTAAQMADANANYGPCNNMVTGQTCIPSCNTGYTLQGSFNLVCLTAPTAGQFDATGASCNPNSCSGGPSMNGDLNMDYTACNTMVTGQMCTPTCNPGFTFNGAGFTLLCVGGKYDANGATCQATACTGPAVADVNALSYSSCNVLVTGQSCFPTCKSGYEQKGTIQLICTPTYDASASTCNLVNCPANAGDGGTPGNCMCNAGYTGTLLWVGNAWSGSCTANPCTSANVPNSVSYDAAGSLNGNTGDSVTIVCKPGYTASFGTATCQASGTWKVPTCTGNTCAPTQVANSVAHSTVGSITGTTDRTVAIACRTGFVCSASPCEAKCLPNRSFFTPVCNAVPCPTNANTPGTCSCNAAYIAMPQSPGVNYDATLEQWTHTCFASCGWHTCSTNPRYILKSAPNTVPCSSPDKSSCNDATCCIGVSINPYGKTLSVTEAGSTTSFMVALVSQPTNPVTIDVVSSRPTEGTVNPAKLIFSSTSWSIGQEVTITGAQDDVDDGDQSFEIQMTVTGDAAFSGRNPEAVKVICTDDDQKGIKITPLPPGSTELVTSEAGTTAMFEVVLESQPTGSVNLQITASDTQEGSLSIGGGAAGASISLTFSTTNWNIVQTVTVSGMNDNIDDGNVSYTIKTFPATSPDPNYNAHNPPDVSVKNIDDDERGILVTTAGTSVTEAGSSTTFTVQLTSQPLSSVVIALSSSDTTEGKVSPASLTFSGGNWNTPIPVTVVGQNDLIDDGDITFQIITGSGQSTDQNYNNFDAADVTITCIDDDVSGVLINPTSGLLVSEKKATSTFTVVLQSQPTAPVTIEIKSRDTTEGTVSPTTLTFTDGPLGTWRTAKTVTVIGVDDLVDDDDIAFNISLIVSSSDPVYNAFSTSNVGVTNADDDAAGLTVTPTSGLFTTESGGQATFTVRLNTQPISAVTIPLATSDSTEGTVIPSTLTFSATNWNVPRTVVITGVDEFIDDDNITYTIYSTGLRSNDAKYNATKFPNVTVTNIDDDVAGIDVKPTSGLVTTERNAGTAEFTIVLTSEPLADVTIDISSDDLTEGTLQAGLTKITFTPLNWNVVQRITVTGVDDTDQDQDVAYTIDLDNVVSTDPKYKVINPQDVSLVNKDDDMPGLYVTPNTSLITSESGGTGGVATFEVWLASIPSAPVTFSIVSSDITEGTVTPSLTFTTNTWNVRQTVTITGVDDNIDDDDVPYTITIGAATTTDQNYNGFPPGGFHIDVINKDDDKAGLVVTPTTGLTTAETGTTATFTVKLTTEPIANVYLRLTPNPREGILTSGTSRTLDSTGLIAITFSNTTWNIPQTVTVTGRDDLIDDGDITYNVSIGPATSGDPNYNGILHPGVTVVNTDNDVANITVTPTTGLVTTEAGGTASFTVVLGTQPTDQVLLWVTSSDTTEGTVSPGSLTFTPTNWNVTQSIVVTGVPDEVDDDNITYTVYLGKAQSNDKSYSGLDAKDVTVINTDDDTANITVSGITRTFTTEAGGTSEFVIALNSEPTSDVTVTLVSGDPTEGTVSPTTVVYTPLTWSVPMTVTITGVDDFIDDGDVLYTIITESAVSLDSKYSGMNPRNVDVNNTDDDEAGVTVSPTVGLSTTEAGGMAIFTVVLNTEPEQSVQIGISSNDTSEGTVQPTVLEFTAGNWQIPQTVTITGVDDDLYDRDVVYKVDVGAASSTDLKYNNLDGPDVLVVNTDDENPGVTVSPTTIRTSEVGGSGVFTVLLTSQPEADVTIDLTNRNTQEGKLSTNRLIFTSGDWKTPKSVTVTGVDDFVDDGDVVYSIVTEKAVSTYAEYNGLDPLDVFVTNVDNDTAAVVVTPKTGLETSESGAQATFTVVLASQPVATVSMSMSSSNTAEGSVLPTSLQFTTGSWNVPQTVTVNGIDDAIDDGDKNFFIRISAATSSDGKYDGIQPGSVAVTNLDNDVRGVNFTLPIGGLTTSEEGPGATTFKVFLTSQPTAVVTLDFVSSDTTEGMVSPRVLSFTTANWDVAQTVTVTGVNDDIFDGDVSYKVLVGAVVSTDLTYNTYDPPDLSVVNLDNDVAGVMLRPTVGGCQTISGPAVGQLCIFPFIYKGKTYTSCTDVDNNKVKWCSTKVNATNHHVPGSEGNCEESCLGGLTTAEAGVDIGTGGVSIGNGHNGVYKIAGTAEFEVRLLSLPLWDVSIGLRSDDITEGTVTPAQLLFRSVNWNVPQTVTVTAVDDSVSDGDVLYTILTSPCESKDSAYNGLNPPDVVVNNTDDDIAGFVIAPTQGLETTEAGGTAVFTVKLQSEPLAGVAIYLNSSDTTEGTVAPAYLHFTSVTWNVAQTVTVTGVADLQADGDQIFTISLSLPVTTDFNFRPIFIPSIEVVNKDVMDECLQHGHFCTSEGQRCNDPNPSNAVLGDWECICMGGATGSARGRAAVCVHAGECLTNSGKCTAVGQTCSDPTMTRLNDWQCECVPPFVGTPQKMNPASCGRNECTLKGSLCTAVGQTCEDPNQFTADDWICKCPEPFTGTAKMAQASCKWSGECTTRYPTCTNMNQTCHDPSPVEGDWECRCLVGVGKSTGRAANCILDECLVNGEVCTSEGQVCRDMNPSPLSLGDWVCECSGSNAVGTGFAQAANCILDECITNWKTCQAVGQVCRDPDKRPSVTNDWICECVPPATGAAPQRAAQCTWQGECQTEASKCTSKGQTCADPNVKSKGDWQCICVEPFSRTISTAGPATCILDECITNRRTCLARGQTCHDPNTDPASLGDWRCMCGAPAIGSKTKGLASCTFQGECTVMGEVCTAAGQTCRDPDTSKTGDWECLCVTPMTGRATRGPAVCVYDECLEYWQTCSSVGQICIDPNPSPTSIGDWTCTCVAPASGTGIARPATCSFIGECITNSATCTVAGQTCNDPNTGFKGDWTCDCVSPAAGRGVGKAADCTLDECITHGAICTSVGQICVDRDKRVNSLGDWTCECSGGSTSGSAVAGVATCVLDECVANGIQCTTVGQKCIDPTPQPWTLGDWICVCQGSATGQAIAQAATCMFVGECQTNSQTCTLSGQTCHDPNLNKNGDWQCVCVEPMSGRATRQPAQCQYDECRVYGKICTAVGQRCSDPNTTPGSRNDWVCDCAGSGVGSAKGKPAVCTYTDACKQRHTTCMAAGQACNDPSGSGGWECQCVLPMTGKATGKAAECVYDECTAFKDTCTALSQTCIDPSPHPSTTGDWTCNCVGGQATGSAIGQGATCILNECIQHGHICNRVGQMCVDPTTDPSSTGDWQCQCVPPATGINTASPATCTYVGECSENAVTCTAVGQSCNDPDTTRTGDWECVCVPPQTGSRSGGRAECIFDECVLHGGVCQAAGQTCHDPFPSPTSLKDWRCNCVSPATGSAAGQPAVCQHVGECVQNAVTCSAAGQACRDPNINTAGDWECMCIGSQKGRAQGQAAQCLQDECLQHGDICRRVGQQCRDPNPSPLSLGDWQCDCVGISTGGSKKGGVATCTWQGGCAQNAQTCTNAGQTCTDPDSQNTNGWRCECVFPEVGWREGKQAPCVLDECLTSGTVCRDAGQNCVDLNKNPRSLNDWQCECIGSATGVRKGGVATCAFTGECATFGDVCADAGQMCRDPDVSVDGDWTCVCVPPYEGGERQSAATCKYNECLVHGKECEMIGQRCVDPNMNVTSLNDWECRCVEPATGKAVARPAECTFVGECVSNFAVCARAGQTCNDPNPSTPGDWECVCVLPALGRSTGKPATCTLNECVQNEPVCTSVGQQCVDPAPIGSSRDDWMCFCVGSAESGSAVGRAAVCMLDECLLDNNAAVCGDAGQQCLDPNPAPESRNDWVCKCIGSSTGDALMAVATCVQAGECASNAPTCTSAGQTCFDPDRTKSRDWMCQCVPPLTGAETTSVARCSLDECLTEGKICEAAGQTCEDPDTSPSSTGDWRCRCPDPLTGTRTASIAVCEFVGECAANAVTCTAAGQTCVDPDDADWMCKCIAPQLGTNRTGAPADCVLDECLLYGKTCTSVGQSCIDPDKSPLSTDDWRCNCVAPAIGSARAIAAECRYIGECAMNAGICAAAGQACNDPDTTKSGDWECVCVPPAVGRGTGAPTPCTYDECTINTPVCAAAGQICQDPNPDPGSIGDWVCKCAGNGRGSAKNMPAVCVWTGECELQATRCTRFGQTCFDPTTNVNDWGCQCVPPQNGTATGGRAQCVLDECTTAGRVCASAGQVCVDRNSSVASTGDWECVCQAPTTGTARASVARCVLDECSDQTACSQCSTNRATCANAGQTCVDPDDTKIGDWQCVCPSPTVGKATGRTAQCQIDECIKNRAVCNAVGQVCNDPNKDPNFLNDWQCECIGSVAMSTPGLQQPATCVYSGECQNALHSDLCRSSGQGCNDPNLGITGDWECICVPPMQGMATRAVATCRLDECIQNKDVCVKAGQTCHDPNTSPTSVNDWTCKCVGSSGIGIARPAECVLDECVANGATCHSAGQICIDPNKQVSRTGDWTCNCQGSSTGSARAMVATCLFTGECATKADVCTSAGQTCVDPSEAPGDWLCRCVAPSLGDDVLGRPASCRLDECVIKGTICTAAGQTCNDPGQDPMSRNDWTCQCAGGGTGSQVAGVATCSWQGECVQNGPVCAAAGQACSDTDQTTQDDWQCSCVPPASGSERASVANCVLDECSERGSICTAAGQTCEDPNTNALSVGDWICKCEGSDAKGQAVGKPATCLLDECIKNGKTCTDVGQQCRDPNLSPESTGDWICSCVGSGVGTQVGSPAACKWSGECITEASTCTAAGQTCVDMDRSSNNNWQCQCVLPMTGSANTGVATCLLDECVSNAAVCNAAGQTCNDPNKLASSTGDWECRCVPPATGSAQGAVATCEYIGECAANARTCTAAGQSCFDPNLDWPGDWQCLCVEPQAGSPSTMMPANCALDECTALNSFGTRVCASAGQLCHDPNTSPQSLGDWQCLCTGSSTKGMAVAAVASCTYTGECQLMSGVCTAVGQTCSDTNPGVNDDWTCMCVSPSVGKAVGKPAECVLDECTRNRLLCGAGQTCNDPNKHPQSIGDWTCNCQTGSGSARGKAAVCILDECIVNGKVCTDMGQVCSDPNPDINSKGDWTCNCVGSARGSAKGQPAPCVYEGECASNAQTCTSAGQACVDTDTTSTGNWQCACVLPQSGQPAYRTKANCAYDECTAGSPGQRICSLVGQTCRDPNPSANSLSDWQCNCVAPVTGVATAGAATCDWQGECKENYRVCTSVGQTCVDNDVTTTGNWMCQCVAPYEGNGAVARAATCRLDECIIEGSLCESVGQRCIDPDFSVQGDWTCQCEGSGTGAAIAKAATCSYTGECKANAKTCTSVGQTCVDPDITLTGDWECRCLSPRIGRKVTSPAICITTLSECQMNGGANAKVCTNQNQTCFDPDLSITGDWECRCKPPSTASAKGQPALCGGPSQPLLFKMAASFNKTRGEINPNELTTAIRNVLTTSEITNITVIDGVNAQTARVLFEVKYTPPSATTQTRGQIGESLRSQLQQDAANANGQFASRGLVPYVVHLGDCASTVASPCGSEQVCTESDGTADGTFICTCRGKAAGKNIGLPATCKQECTTCTPVKAKVNMEVRGSVAELEANRDKFQEAAAIALGVPKESLTELTFTEGPDGKTTASFFAEHKNSELTEEAFTADMNSRATADISQNGALHSAGFKVESATARGASAISPPGDDDDTLCFGQSSGICILVIVLIAAVVLSIVGCILWRLCKSPPKPLPPAAAPTPKTTPLDAGSPPNNVRYNHLEEEYETKEMEPIVDREPIKQPAKTLEPQNDEREELLTPMPDQSPQGDYHHMSPHMSDPNPSYQETYASPAYASPSVASYGRGRTTPGAPSVRTPYSMGRGITSIVETTNDAPPGTSGWV